jgi:HK97 gp10 family phage protein
MSGTVKVTFQGLDTLTQRLRAVGAASQAVFCQAAEAGGRVVQSAAIANAPGPLIGLDVKAESNTRAVASVGPLRGNHSFYYRFFEFGTKAHSATGKADDTNSRSFKRYLKRIGRTDLASTVTPRMMMRSGGGWKTPQKVRGVAAKPFLRPAMERVEEITSAVGAVYEQAILEKAR